MSFIVPGNWRDNVTPPLRATRAGLKPGATVEGFFEAGFLPQQSVKAVAAGPHSEPWRGARTCGAASRVSCDRRGLPGWCGRLPSDERNNSKRGGNFTNGNDSCRRLVAYVSLRSRFSARRRASSRARCWCRASAVTRWCCLRSRRVARLRACRCPQSEPGGGFSQNSMDAYTSIWVVASSLGISAAM